MDLHIDKFFSSEYKTNMPIWLFPIVHSKRFHGVSYQIKIVLKVGCEQNKEEGRGGEEGK